MEFEISFKNITIYMSYSLVLEIVECMMDFQFLLSQVIPVLFNYSQHWLKEKRKKFQSSGQ